MKIFAKFILTLCCATAIVTFSACHHKKPTQTINNLIESVKGKEVATAQYTAFAQKAREEGFDTIAKLFEAASKATSISLEIHQKVLESAGGKMPDFKPDDYRIGNTEANLQAALTAEEYYSSDMYPSFIQDAQSEVKHPAVQSATENFENAAKVGAKLATCFRNALSALQAHDCSSLPGAYVVCPTCGNISEDTEAAPSCEICGQPADKYIKI